MAHQIEVANSTSKEARYQALLPQIEALITGESDQIANQANVVAALKETFDFFWVGFYRVQANELVLGPFQGPVACTRIGKGKGVCGTVWAQSKTMIVPDVNQFPGHIACNAAAKSEIVVPVKSEEQVYMVLDVDSDQLDAFDQIDARYLEAICDLLRPVDD